MMNRSRNPWRWLSAVAVVLSCGGQAVAAAAGPWTSAEHDGRIEARRGGALLMAWQNRPLENPVGGSKFAASAFLHPLRTPSGFEWTAIQAPDHLHHFGLWWPWKYIEVNGQSYNCWEIQEGQGAHVARSVKQRSGGPDTLEWEFSNETVIKPPGRAAMTVIKETARVVLGAAGEDAMVIDVSLQQQSVGSPVTIMDYRYSGFSWRGPLSWNKDNSHMLTSEGRDRDHANGQPARWVLVGGPTPNGSATVLLMSAASDLAGAPECLRVWDSTNGKGMPFVNFNPVMHKALLLDDAHPAVSNRKYRVLAADRQIDAPAAEAEWRKWLGK